VHDGGQTTSDAFDYQVLDGQGGAATATVNITVTPVNDPPLAVDDDLGSVAEGSSVTGLAVLANDSDPDGSLDVTSVTIVGSTNGTATANPDGTVNFTHNGSPGTTASFTYTVNDDLGAPSNVATASLAVAGFVHVTTPAGTAGYSTEGGKTGDKHLTVTVTLVDGSGAPIEGATVTATIDGDGPGLGGGTGITDASGQVVFKITNAPSGTYTTTVTEVTAVGFTWDGVTPPNSFSK
jgi:hypothetical protein